MLLLSFALFIAPPQAVGVTSGAARAVPAHIGQTIHVPSDQPTIQAGIDAAAPGDEVLVAPGTYSESIQLADGVRLSSVAGPATTILEGTGSDSILLGVVTLSRATRVRGFTFRAGSAGSDTAIKLVGAARPTIRDCVFRGAFSGQDILGSGAISSSWYAFPLVDRCIFDGENEPSPHGAAWNFYAASTAFSNCTFTRYSTTSVITITDGRVILLNCTLAENNAAAVERHSGYLSVYNSILRNNTGLEILSRSSVNTDVQYSNIRGGQPGAGNIDATPRFVDSRGGDFRLLGGSPGVDAGSNSLTSSPRLGPFFPTLRLDLAHGPRYSDDPATPDTGEGTVPIIDMGAYEFPGP